MDASPKFASTCLETPATPRQGAARQPQGHNVPIEPVMVDDLANDISEINDRPGELVSGHSYSIFKVRFGAQLLQYLREFLVRNARVCVQTPKFRRSSLHPRLRLPPAVALPFQRSPHRSSGHSTALTAAQPPRVARNQGRRSQGLGPTQRTCMPVWLLPTLQLAAVGNPRQIAVGQPLLAVGRQPCTNTLRAKRRKAGMVPGEAE